MGMTNAEAKAFLQGRIDLIDKHYPQIEDYREALVMAVKALEQEKVLEKIKAEIIQMQTISSNANDIYKADVLQIINKYKAESED